MTKHTELGGKLLGDENVDDPEEQTANGYGRNCIQIIDKNRRAGEKEAIANMDDGLEAEDITGAAAARADCKQRRRRQSVFLSCGT